MNDLLKLAERCEQAKGLNRDLNCDIAMATGIRASMRDLAALGFTGSLDAAMTLVPEGHVMAVTNCGTDSPRGPDWTKASAVVGKEEDHATEPVTAATPALALCAAALRARAASCDTLPKGQDAKQGLAGTEGSAVGSEASETPPPSDLSTDKDG